jgi:hypothetical protein
MIFRPKNKKIIFISLLALAVGAIVFWINRDDPRPGPISGESHETKTETYSAINGVLSEKAVAERRPISVMIENHPDSRPQSGLSEADVVYEVLAEGGITRFLAIFQTKQPDTIGPVRSARDYFAEVADEWKALYAHVGGSNEVIEALKKGLYKNISDVNEYYNETYFGRDKAKPAPHNVFTSYVALQKWLKDKQEEQKITADLWKFKDDLPLPAEVATQKINMDFSRAGYEVGYVYSTSTNSYLRELYFEPHLDSATGKQIEAKNVVVQIIRVDPVPKDPLLRVDINLASGGRAVIFRDGEVVEGRWKKENNRTRYFDLSGKEIELNRGPIWIELLPQEKEASLVWK